MTTAAVVDSSTPQEIMSNTPSHGSNDLWERIITLNNGPKKHFKEHLKELRIGQKKYFKELKKIRQAGLLPYETRPRPTATEYDELKERILKLHNEDEMQGIDIAEELDISKHFVSKVLTTHRKAGNKVESVGMLKKIRIINESNEQLQWYRDNELYPPIKRDMYYRLKELGFIKKSDANYKSFCTLTAEACRGVDSTYSKVTELPRMELGDFKDDRWKQPLGSCDMDDSGSEPTPAQAAEDSGEYITRKIQNVKYILTIIQNRIQELKYAPSNYDGSITKGEEGEDPGFMYNQPTYTEFWCESNAFLEKLEKFQGEKHVKVRSNGGFSSVDKYRKNCEQLKDWVESHDNIKKVIIKYWGDLDASGHFLDTNVMRALKFYITGETSEKDEEPENPFTWNGIEFEFERVAILEEHVEDFGGEPLVQEDEDTQKEDEENKDSRFKKFEEAYPKLIEKYGDKFGVQLEALTTTDERLQAFRELIDSTIMDDWDEDTWLENCPDEDYDYDANGEEEPEDVDPDDVIPDMIKEVTDSFKPGWEKDEGYDHTVPQITDAFQPGWWKEIEDYTQYDIDDGDENEEDGTELPK